MTAEMFDGDFHRHVVYVYVYARNVTVFMCQDSNRKRLFMHLNSVRVSYAFASAVVSLYLIIRSINWWAHKCTLQRSVQSIINTSTNTANIDRRTPLRSFFFVGFAQLAHTCRASKHCPFGDIITRYALSFC